MAGFQAEMDSALVSRLTQPDQKLMKSKEIEKKKKKAESDLGDWDRNGRSWKTKEVALDEKGFSFRRLVLMADGSEICFHSDRRIESSHIVTFSIQDTI